MSDWYWSQDERRRGAAAFDRAIQSIPYQMICHRCDRTFEASNPFEALCKPCLYGHPVGRERERQEEAGDDD